MGADVFTQGISSIRMAVAVLDGTPSVYWRSLAHTAGLRQFTVLSDFESLRMELARQDLDLLLISTPLRGVPAVGRAVQAIRRNSLGDDPFLPVVVATESPSADELKHLVDGGIDGVLTRPLSIGKILERARYLTFQRPDFAVTSDYVGPDRRFTSRPEQTASTPLLPVPNALHDRIVTGMPLADRLSRRQHAWREVSAMHLEHCAASLSLLSARCFPSALQGDFGEAVMEDMRRIAVLAEEAWRRLKDRIDFSQGMALAQNGGEVAQDVRAFIKAPASMSRDRLQALYADVGQIHYGLVVLMRHAASARA